MGNVHDSMCTEIFNKEKASPILEWLSGERQEMPEDAHSWIEAVNRAYKDRTGKDQEGRRRRTDRQSKAGSMLSISALMKKADEEERRIVTDRDMERREECARQISETIRKAMEASKKDQDHQKMREEELRSMTLNAETLARAARQTVKANGLTTSWSHIHYTVFMTYGLWLARKAVTPLEDREVPKAGKYGPIFLSIFRMQKGNDNDAKKDYYALEKVRTQPELHALLADTAMTVHGMKTKDLSDMHCSAGTPWKRAVDKENSDMSESDIVTWFRKQARKQEDKNTLSLW